MVVHRPFARQVRISACQRHYKVFLPELYLAMMKHSGGRPRGMLAVEWMEKCTEKTIKKEKGDERPPKALQKRFKSIFLYHPLIQKLFHTL